MKKTLRIILSLFTTFITGISFGQIIYTDINPDVTLQASNADSYPIDLDNGGTIDMIVFADIKDTTVSGFAVQITGVAIQTLNNTQIIGHTQQLGNETVVVADTLQNMHLIDGTANYVDNSTPSVYPGVGLGVNGAGANLGDFQANGNLSFGVKFDINGNTHYGWVQVNIAANCVSGVLLDYAYQSIADSSIYAGDMGSGFTSVNEINETEAEIKTFNNSFRINSNTKNGTIQVVNIIGKTVLNEKCISNKMYSLDDLPSGIYLINYRSDNYSITKKIWIQ